MLAGIVLKVTLTQTKLSGKNEKKKKKTFVPISSCLYFALEEL